MYSVNKKPTENNEEQNRLLLESKSIINIRAISNDFYANSIQSASLEQFFVVFHSFVNRITQYAKYCVSSSDVHTNQKGAEIDQTIYLHLDSLERKIFESFNFELNQYYKVEFNALNPHSSSYCGNPDLFFFNGWRPHQNFCKKPTNNNQNKRKGVCRFYPL